MGNILLGALLGAVALGILWSITTMGVFISYRILSIPDLTVQGSLVLGAGTAAVAIAAGFNPFLASLFAMLAGMSAGIITGFLHTKLRIPALLSGILCMIALYSINLRVMSAPNIPLLRVQTVFSPIIDVISRIDIINMAHARNISVIITGLVFTVIVIAVVFWFFRTEIGNAIRATGNNIKMAKAQGVNTNISIMLGLTISNGLVGLSGGLIAQNQGFSDIGMGEGAIVIGLACLFIGEVLFGKKNILRALIAIVFGAIIYRFIIALVLEAGMRASDLNLITAAAVAIALFFPTAKNLLSARIKRSKEIGLIALINYCHENGLLTTIRYCSKIGLRTLLNFKSRKGRGLVHLIKHQRSA